MRTVRRMRRRNLRLIQAWCGVRAGRGLAGGSAYSRARGSGAAAELAAAGQCWEVMHIVVEKCCKKKSGVYKSSV